MTDEEWLWHICQEPIILGETPRVFKCTLNCFVETCIFKCRHSWSILCFFNLSFSLGTNEFWKCLYPVLTFDVIIQSKFILRLGRHQLNRKEQNNNKINFTWLQIECADTIRSIMDSRIGLDYIVENREYVAKLASALDTANSTVKKQVFELLSALCVYNADGYSRTLDALEHFKNLKGMPMLLTILWIRNIIYFFLVVFSDHHHQMTFGYTATDRTAPVFLPTRSFLEISFRIWHFIFYQTSLFYFIAPSCTSGQSGLFFWIGVIPSHSLTRKIENRVG